MQAREYVRDVIKEKCIVYPPHGEYMLGKLPGTRYTSQFNLNNALFESDFLEAVGKCFIDGFALDHNSVVDFQLAGTPQAAPLLSFLPYYIKQELGYDINAFMVRDEPKTYGQNSIIEGIPNDMNVLLIDPLCNSTGAFAHCDRALKKDFHVLDFCWAILNKYNITSEEDKHDRYSGQRCFSILTRDDL